MSAGATRAGDLIQIVDERTLPVVVLRRCDLDALRSIFHGRRLQVARAIYTAIVETVTERGSAVTRREIADCAGVTKKALDDYVPELEESGLVHVERRRDGQGSNLPSLWTLGGAPRVPSHPDDPVQTPPTPLPIEDDERPQEEEGSGEEKDWPDAPSPDMVADAESLLRAKTRVGGRIVTREEMMLAVLALGTFNDRSGREVGVSAHLTAVVGRIRERPSWDGATHVRLIDSAFRLKWWEQAGRKRRGRVTPAVIYGNEKVFEAVIQDAADERDGTLKPGGSAARFVKKSRPSEDKF